MRDLKEQPRWSAVDLGQPIPDSPHACLVSLPTWDSVIGYEENRSDVVDRMQAGYPRFFIHPTTQTLFSRWEEELASDERVLGFSGEQAAGRAVEFVNQREGQARLITRNGLSGIAVAPESYQSARKYWQHAGEIVSSRQAEDALHESSAPANSTLRSSLAKIFDTPENDCFIFETGMAAIFALYRAITDHFPGRKTLQLSFPYVDALKIQEHFGVGVDFVCEATGPNLEKTLATIREGTYAAVFCEVPSNPLLRTVDVRALAEACREVDTLLLVDDTVASHANVDVLSVADAVSTSLTKWLSGVGDVMGGSVRINPQSIHASWLRSVLEADVPGGSRLYDGDAHVLEQNARGFSERVQTSNKNGLAVAEFLQGHPAVEKIWYPTCVDRAEYESVLRPAGGYGGLMSFVLRDRKHTPQVYDAMRFSKGPSLGMEYSLLCPYTLLAHYHELEWARSCGVEAELLRLSVGLEPLDELQSRLQEAFALLP